MLLERIVRVSSVPPATTAVRRIHGKVQLGVNKLPGSLTIRSGAAHLSIETGIHTNLIADDTCAPHNVGAGNGVDEVGIVDLEIAGINLENGVAEIIGRIYNSFCCCFCSCPVLHGEGDTGLHAESHGKGHHGLVFGKSGLGSCCSEKGYSLGDIGGNLSVDLLNRGTGFALGCGGGGLGIDGHAGLGLVAFVGAREALGQHEVGVCPDGIGLTHAVHHIEVVVGHIGLVGDYEVGVGNPGVVGIPQVVRTPCSAGVTGLYAVNGIVPEPTGTSSSHNHIVAHNICHKVVGGNAEALVSVAGGGPACGVHASVDTVKGDHGALCGLDHVTVY